jgi:hypothetical protein
MDNFHKFKMAMKLKMHNNKCMGCLIMFPSLKALWPQNVVTTMVIPNNILINGNNNVSGTIAESGGVGPSINGL